MPAAPPNQVPNPDSIQITVTQPLAFLNAAVTGFTSNFGFNSSPSTLNVSLVNDTEINTIGFVEDGGIGEGNTPGVFAYLEVDNSNDNFDNFTFGGLIQSWTKSSGTSGTSYEVVLSDPRVLFAGIPVVTSLNSLGSSTNNNIMDFLGYYNGNIINAGWTPEGFKWSKFKSLMENWVGRFYGTDYRFAFDASFNVPNNYIIDIQDTTLDALMGNVVANNGLDYFIRATPFYSAGGNPLLEAESQTLLYVLITFYGINRRTQIGGDELLNDEFEAFINQNSDTLISHTFGRELRVDPNNVVIWGEKKHEMYSNSANGSDRSYDPRPIYNEFADGNITDRPFVNLETLVFGDFTDYNQLPHWPFEARSLTVSTVTIGEDPEYKKQRLLMWTPGYFVDEYILRAALYSQEAWETAVWYTYKDGIRRERLLNNILAVDSFDMYPLNLGQHISDFFNGNTPKTILDLLDQGYINLDASTIPERLGITRPPLNRAYPDTVFNVTAGANIEPDEVIKFKEQLREAIFQETLKVANGFYGKKFIVRLPDSNIIDTLKDSAGSNPIVYEYLSKRHEIEYAVADSAWVEPTEVPFIIKNNENNIYQAPDGKYKPLIILDIDNLRKYNDDWVANAVSSDPSVNPLPDFQGASYNELYDSNNLFYRTYINFDNHDLNTALKVSKSDDGVTAPSSLGLTSNFYLYKGGITVTQYQFDPRFAIIELDEHINIGNSFTRYMKESLFPSDDDYDTTQISVDMFEVKPTDDESKEFISWLYQFHQVISPANGTYSLLNGGLIVDGLLYGGHIDARYYYNKINQGGHQTYKGSYGFAPRRLCRIDFIYNTQSSLFQYKVPLIWNYLRYGPFTNSISETGNTQVIVDASLSPWSYGSTSNMNFYGLNQVNAAESQNMVINTAQINLAGYPILNLGDSLGINANVTGLNLSYGIDGIKTNYSFRTFIGSPALLKKGERDLQNQLKVGEVGFSTNTRLDAPFREFLKDFKKLKDTVFNLTDKYPSVKTSIKNKPGTTKGPTVSNRHIQTVSREAVTKEINYTDLHTTSETNISHPYTTDSTITGAGTDNQSVPSFTGLVASQADDISNNADSYKNSPNSKHPYVGAEKSLENITHGSEIPTSLDQDVDYSDVRSIGNRVPTVFVGWGYDTLGRPVPASGLTLNNINTQTNLDLPRPYYGHVPFYRCNTMRGAETPSSHYAAGPMDIVWDHRRGEWKGEKFIYARIVDSKTILSGTSYSQRVYSWFEVIPKLILDESMGFSTFTNIGWYTPTSPAYGSIAFGTNDTDYFGLNAAVNIAETSSTPSNRSVTAGTIVRLYHDTDHQYGKPFYYFNHPLLDETIPQFRVISVKNMATILSGRTWQYGVGSAHTTSQGNVYNYAYSLNNNPITYTFYTGFAGQANSDSSNSGLDITSAKQIVYAINTLETENNIVDGSLVTPIGIDLDNLPAGWERQPIPEDTQVLAYADPYQLIYKNSSDGLYYNISIYKFCVPNAYDGPCP